MHLLVTLNMLNICRHQTVHINIALSFYFEMVKLLKLG